MIGLLCFALAVLASPFKSTVRLEAENAVLRHQLIVLRRRLHGRGRVLDFRTSTSASALGGSIAFRASSNLLWITVHTEPFFSMRIISRSPDFSLFDLECGSFALDRSAPRHESSTDVKGSALNCPNSIRSNENGSVCNWSKRPAICKTRAPIIWLKSRITMGRTSVTETPRAAATGSAIRSRTFQPY